MTEHIREHFLAKSMVNKVPGAPFAVALPLPVAVLATGQGDQVWMMTSAWLAPVCEKPPIMAVALRSGHHFRDALEQCGELTIQFMGQDDLAIADGCIIERTLPEAMSLWSRAQPLDAALVATPLVQPGLLHLEARLRAHHTFEGSHDLYLVDILRNWYDNDILTPTGYVDFDTFRYLSFTMGQYRGHAVRLSQRSNYRPYRPVLGDAT
jgi:flavin reductase (DIM6/NTAB) family NADH-FMN oxidoreductase RutF